MDSVEFTDRVVIAYSKNKDGVFNDFPVAGEAADHMVTTWIRNNVLGAIPIEQIPEEMLQATHESLMRLFKVAFLAGRATIEIEDESKALVEKLEKMWNTEVE